MSNYLYRVLREDENPAMFGLTAKNPNAHKSLEEHVENGSWGSGSQYISCSNNKQSAIDFGMKKAGNPPFWIAKLNRHLIENNPNIIVHDVSFGPFTSEKANNFARYFGEVVLEGYVPKAYVVSVTQYPGGMQ